MGDESVLGPAYRKDAKEYARFCRIRRLFMVDGLEPWRDALRKRGLSEAEIAPKISAAVHFVRTMGEPSLPPSEQAVDQLGSRQDALRGRRASQKS